MIKKYKLVFLAVAALVLVMALGVGVGLASGSTTINIEVKNSTGDPVQGAKVYLGVGGWPYIGETGADGKLEYTHNSSLGNMRVQVTAPNNGGTETTAYQDTSVNPTFQLQTHQAVIQLIDHNGDPLSGGKVEIGHGGWPVIGTTNADGKVYHEYFAGTQNFRMSYNYGTETKSHTHTAGGSTLVFQTGLVDLQFSGTVAHGVSGWPLYAGPTEMLPVEHRFGFSGSGYTRKEIHLTPIVGGVLEKSIFYVRLRNSSGAGIEGGSAQLGVGGWPSMGTTGSDGILLYARDGKVGNMRVQMTAPLGGTQTSPMQNHVANSFYNFQTAQLIVQLIDHNGSPLSGGEVRIGDGGWPVIGTTDADGKVYHEHFAATKEFRMSYNYGTETKSHTHTEGGSTLVFQTGLVDLQFSGTVKHGVGGWPLYTGPTEMLPVEHRFAFSGTGYSSKELRLTPTAGGLLEKSIFYVRLRNSSGAGIEGGSAQLGVGGWPSMGTTGSDGILLYARDGKVGNIQVRMTAPLGGTQTSSSQNHAKNSFYDFQTARVVIQLKDSEGVLLNGGIVRAGFGGWPVIGTTGDNGQGTLYHEMLPGQYNFRTTFNDTTATKNQNIATPVVFQTVQAEIQLIDSEGNLLDGGVVRFGTSGWPVIGTTGDAGAGTVTREMFEGSYNFRMTYNGTTVTMNQDIATPVVF